MRPVALASVPVDTACLDEFGGGDGDLFAILYVLGHAWAEPVRVSPMMITIYLN